MDGEEKESVSHEIDHVKKFSTGVFALEIEWNNKDQFFDRDLENFKRLHADGVISVGGIITRGSSLNLALCDIIEDFARNRNIDSMGKLEQFYSPTTRQKKLIENAAQKHTDFEKGWATVFAHDKFAESTTHWRKLKDRVDRGVGNPCPLVLIGIPKDVVVND